MLHVFCFGSLFQILFEVLVLLLLELLMKRCSHRVDCVWLSRLFGMKIPLFQLFQGFAGLEKEACLAVVGTAGLWATIQASTALLLDDLNRFWYSERSFAFEQIHQALIDSGYFQP